MWPDSYAPHLRSWCLHGDDICNFTGVRVATCLVSCTHETGYISSGYTRDAAFWTYHEWKKLPTPSSSPTPSAAPSPSSTPTPIPSPSATSTGTWTATEAPLPTSYSDVNLNGVSCVSCVSASQCVAVGYAAVSEVQEGLLLTESGGSWTAAEAPLPAGASDPFLMGVSCESASQCVAAGYYTDASGNLQGLLLTDSGGSWTASEAPLPAGASDGGLMGVSCVSASQCVAVGFTDVSGVPQGLLLTESSGSLTAAEAPLPAGASDSGVTPSNFQLNGRLLLVSIPVRRRGELHRQHRFERPADRVRRVVDGSLRINTHGYEHGPTAGRLVLVGIPVRRGRVRECHRLEQPGSAADRF